MLVKIGAADPAPLKIADLPLGGPQTLAWPMQPANGTVRDGSRLNKVLLLRLDPAGFDRGNPSPLRRWRGRLFGDLPSHGMRGRQMARRDATARVSVPFFAIRPEEGSRSGRRAHASAIAGVAAKGCRRAARRRQAVHRACSGSSSKPDIVEIRVTATDRGRKPPCPDHTVSGFLIGAGALGSAVGRGGTGAKAAAGFAATGVPRRRFRPFCRVTSR